MSILYSVIVFVVVILVHEFGHFIVAKMQGIKVNEFSIGMGPEIFSKKGEETQYTLRALPVGGYVALEGEEDDSDDPRSFNNAHPLQRIAVLFSGALMNFLLALLVFSIAFGVMGEPTTKVETASEGYPAQVSGIMPGDKIIKIEDFEINEWNDISKTLNEIDKETVLITVERNDSKLELPVSPITENDSKIIGITSKYEKNIGNAFGSAVGYTIQVVKSVYGYVLGLITGKVNVSGLSGPVGIVKMIGQSSQNGILGLLLITGMISANLGAFNLLPFPALDGGTIVINFIEMITGKKVPEKVRIGLNIFGLTLLFGLIIYVTIFNDIL